MVAAQDQALAVRAIQNCIYGMSVPLNCRVCGVVPEYNYGLFAERLYTFGSYHV